MEIRYLSHGIIETGGYRHTLFFARELQKKYAGAQLNILRKKKTYNGFGHIQLQWWAFKNSGAGINIVVVRLALASILKNLFSNNKVFIIMHNYDETDGKAPGLKIYYGILFFVLRALPSKRIRVLTDSPFFKDNFQQHIKEPILLFPNFFNTKLLSTFKSPTKLDRIHLGQWSAKNSNEVFRLAGLLKQNGYSSYFSTLNESMAQTSRDHDILFFETYEKYLHCMAESKYTIAFPSVNEGWNRVAHESILVGTTVIGFNKGGLGYLLKEANMFMVTAAEEALEIILSNKHKEAEAAFFHKYDIENANLRFDNFGLE